MIKQIIMDVHLTLTGPLLTQSSSPGELGLDRVVAINNEKTPYLAGTLITGKLRQALEELDDIVADKCQWFKPEVNTWFGKKSTDYSPQRKQIYCSDFILDLKGIKELKNGEIRDRITIEQATGTAKDQHIVMIESPFISGKEYTFYGHLHFFAPESKQDNIIKHLKTAFNWLTQIGSMKSIGFGQVVGVKFNNEIQTKQNNNQVIEDFSYNNEEKIALTLKPLYSFCLAGKPKSNNLFESDAIISGGAILGSIASTWSHLLDLHLSYVDNDSKRQALVENFSLLRISHAFPVESSTTNQRPVVAPLSLCSIGSNQLYDICLLSKPCLIAKQAPDFSLDWKNTKETLTQYPWPYLRLKDWGWTSLDSELRVRTGIDRTAKRSEENKLFSYEQIIPNEQVWQAQLDLSRIEKSLRKNVFSQFEDLLSEGFMGLGKTKTPVGISFHAIENIPASILSNTQMPDNKFWVLTLQTDSLLGSPEALNESSGHDQLWSMYQKAWREISENSLELVRFFARQKLSGGDYQKCIFQCKDYKPWLLSEAGSVFVLKANNDDVQEDAQEKIIQWLNNGLPLANSTCSYYSISKIESEQWKTCPFIPQNGYGEIAVNLKMPEQVTILNDNSSEIDLITIAEEN